MQSPVVSVAPVTLSSPGRSAPLQVRASAPATGEKLPVIAFSHGFASSMDAYAPLAKYWAAHGFVVIQPTFLDSRTLIANPKADHAEAVAEYLKDPRKPHMWRYRVEDVERVLDQLDLVLAAVPGLVGRVDRARIAAVGHSFGAQTTSALLGARVNDEDLSDTRVSAGILLSAGAYLGVCGNGACSVTTSTWTTTPGSAQNRPINMVNWFDAYAFCIWDGGFLPSQAEWEFAAAGG